MTSPDHRRRGTPRLRTAKLGTLLLSTLLAGAFLAAVPGPASAHVRVHADVSTAGSFAELTFRVPTESATATTVKVSVQLPQDTPMLEVNTKPVPGWSVAVVEAPLPKPVQFEGTTLTKAPRTVTWTATDKADRIQPEQFQEFSIAAGPLPPAGTLMLPATQTYSDGTVVRWDEPTPASGDEPEHPSPSLQITAAAGGGPMGMDPAPSAPPAGSGTFTRPTDPVARGLGGAALAVGVAGLVVALLGLRRRQAAP